MWSCGNLSKNLAAPEESNVEEVTMSSSRKYSGDEIVARFPNQSSEEYRRMLKRQHSTYPETRTTGQESTANTQHVQNSSVHSYLNKPQPRELRGPGMTFMKRSRNLAGNGSPYDWGRPEPPAGQAYTQQEAHHTTELNSQQFPGNVQQARGSSIGNPAGQPGVSSTQGHISSYTYSVRRDVTVSSYVKCVNHSLVHATGNVDVQCNTNQQSTGRFVPNLQESVMINKDLSARDIVEFQTRNGKDGFVQQKSINNGQPSFSEVVVSRVQLTDEAVFSLTNNPAQRTGLQNICKQFVEPDENSRRAVALDEKERAKMDELEAAEQEKLLQADEEYKQTMMELKERKKRAAGNSTVMAAIKGEAEEAKEKLDVTRDDIKKKMARRKASHKAIFERERRILMRPSKPKLCDATGSSSVLQDAAPASTLPPPVSLACAIQDNAQLHAPAPSNSISSAASRVQASTASSVLSPSSSTHSIMEPDSSTSDVQGTRSSNSLSSACNVTDLHNGKHKATSSLTIRSEFVSPLGVLDQLVSGLGCAEEQESFQYIMPPSVMPLEDLASEPNEEIPAATRIPAGSQAVSKQSASVSTYIPPDLPATTGHDKPSEMTQRNLPQVQSKRSNNQESQKSATEQSGKEQERTSVCDVMVLGDAGNNLLVTFNVKGFAKLVHYVIRAHVFLDAYQQQNDVNLIKGGNKLIGIFDSVTKEASMIEAKLMRGLGCVQRVVKKWESYGRTADSLARSVSQAIESPHVLQAHVVNTLFRDLKVAGDNPTVKSITVPKYNALHNISVAADRNIDDDDISEDSGRGETPTDFPVLECGLQELLEELTHVNTIPDVHEVISPKKILLEGDRVEPKENTSSVPKPAHNVGNGRTEYNDPPLVQMDHPGRPNPQPQGSRVVAMPKPPEQFGAEYYNRPSVILEAEVPARQKDFSSRNDVRDASLPQNSHQTGEFPSHNTGAGDNVLVDEGQSLSNSRIRVRSLTEMQPVEPQSEDPKRQPKIFSLIRGLVAILGPCKSTGELSRTSGLKTTWGLASNCNQRPVLANWAQSPMQQPPLHPSQSNWLSHVQPQGVNWGQGEPAQSVQPLARLLPDRTQGNASHVSTLYGSHQNTRHQAFSTSQRHVAEVFSTQGGSNLSAWNGQHSAPFQCASAEQPRANYPQLSLERLLRMLPSDTVAANRQNCVPCYICRAPASRLCSVCFRFRFCSPFCEAQHHRRAHQN